MPTGGGGADPSDVKSGSGSSDAGELDWPDVAAATREALASAARLLDQQAKALGQLELGLGELVAAVAEEDQGYPLRLDGIRRSSFPVRKADQVVKWVKTTLGPRTSLRLERVLDRVLFWDAVEVPRAVGEYVVWRSRLGPRKHRLVLPANTSELAGWRTADWRRSSKDLLLRPAVRVLSIGCPGVEALLGEHAELILQRPPDVAADEVVLEVDLVVVGGDALAGPDGAELTRLLERCAQLRCPAAVWVGAARPEVEAAAALVPQGVTLLAPDFAVGRDASAAVGRPVVSVGPIVDLTPSGQAQMIGACQASGCWLKWLQSPRDVGHEWSGSLAASWRISASPDPDQAVLLAPEPDARKLARVSCLLFDREIASASPEELDLLVRAMSRRHAVFIPPQEQPLPGPFADAPLVTVDRSREAPAAFANEHELHRLGHLSWRHAASQFSRGEAVRRVTGHTGIPRLLAGLPLVSVICVSFRPERLAQCLEQYRAQSYPRKELILVANRDALSESWVQAALSHDDITLLRTDAMHSLGASLNRARAVAEGEVWAKIDDDDYYGPNYLADQVLALREANAAVVGKGTFFTYVEGQKQLYLTSQVPEHCASEYFVHGGTIVAHRRRVEMVDFAPVARGTDTLFLQQCRLLALRVYSTDRYNFAYFRYSGAHHTFDVPQATFLGRSEHIANEFDRTLIDV